MPPEITAIVPAYNIAEYIGEAIGSALKQQPPFKRIIVVDDGSTDATQDVVSRFSDPRILYYYQKNQGLGPARNKGIELSDTEYIYFMDGDDVLSDGMTHFIYESIENSQIRPDAIFFSAVDFSHETGRKLKSSEYFKWKLAGQFASGKDALHASLRSNGLPACAFLYVFSRSVIENPDPLRFLNIIHEDEVFTPNLFLRCGSTIISNEVFYNRRVRKGSIMSTPRSSRNSIGYLIASCWWGNLAIASDGASSTLFKRQARHFYSRAVVYMVLAGLQLDQARRLVKEYMPCPPRNFVIDYLLGKVSRISRKLSASAIRLRARVVHWPA